MGAIGLGFDVFNAIGFVRVLPQVMLYNINRGAFGGGGNGCVHPLPLPP